MKFILLLPFIFIMFGARSYDMHPVDFILFVEGPKDKGRDERLVSMNFLRQNCDILPNGIISCVQPMWFLKEKFCPGLDKEIERQHKKGKGFKEPKEKEMDLGQGIKV